jgi:DNA-binding NarL/FixJ family response regulator
VKLQHQGKRRTFSLAARTRAAAGEEARQLDAQLRAQGWEAVWPRQDGSSGRDHSREDVRFWREHLVAQSPATGSGTAPQFSVWVPHEGAMHCFPLRATDPEAAATEALAVYRLVAGSGWKQAFDAVSREVTLGLHWNPNPFLCTYTTLHTILANPPFISPKIRKVQPQFPVFLMEPEPGLYRALERCFEPGVCRNGEELLPGGVSPPNNPGGICLLNRDVADQYGLQTAEGPTTLSNGIPVIPYVAYSSSDELFRLTPGKRSGYCLKRMPKDELLTPVASCLAASRPRLTALIQASRAFFQSWVQAPLPSRAAEEPNLLTGREREVLGLLSRGFVDKEIAQTLGISGWTVHEHVKRIFEKLHVHSRTEAALAYLKK